LVKLSSFFVGTFPFEILVIFCGIQLTVVEIFSTFT